MRTRFLMALGARWALALASSAVAQQPTAPAPPPTAQRPDYGLPITNEQAKAVAAAALAEAKKNNWRMAISIVGPAGELVYFEKMDGMQLASTEISQAKARTAVHVSTSEQGVRRSIRRRQHGFHDIPRKARGVGGRHADHRKR